VFFDGKYEVSVGKRPPSRGPLFEAKVKGLRYRDGRQQYFAL